MAQDIKEPDQGFVGGELFYPKSHNSFDFNVGGMMPGTYRMRVQAMSSLTDKPVKSNSVKFTVSNNPDTAWQIGGAEYDNIQSCTLYECSCAYFNSCSNEAGDESGGVLGKGY
jgi:hypothetical protein